MNSCEKRTRKWKTSLIEYNFHCYCENYTNILETSSRSKSQQIKRHGTMKIIN